MREEIFDKVILGMGIIYFIGHGFITERWEIVIPLFWGVLLMVVCHAFKAAYDVSKGIGAEIKAQSAPRESIILTASGEKASFAVTPVKPALYRVRLYGMACVLLCLSAFASVYVWKFESPVGDLRPMFIRECDRPLIGIYAIATIRKQMTGKDLGQFGFHVQLHDVFVNPGRSGLFLSAFPTAEHLPTLRPPFAGPLIQGMKSAVWSSPAMAPNNGQPRPFSVLSNVFVMGYVSLDRIEAGGPSQRFSFLGHGRLEPCIHTNNRFCFVSQGYTARESGSEQLRHLFDQRSRTVLGAD